MEEYIEKNLTEYSNRSAFERLKLSNQMSVICGTFLLIFDISRTGFFCNFITKFLIILAYGVVISQFELIKKGYLSSSNVSIIIGETYNFILIYLSYFHYPNYSIIWSQISTCVFFYYQGFQCQSLKKSFFLGLKHSGQWIGLGLYFNKINIINFSCLIISSCYLIVSLIQTIYYEHQVAVKILQSNYEVKSANEKVVSILETLADYIIVLSKENKELYINSPGRSFTGISLLVDKLKSFSYSKTYKNPFFESEQISTDIQKTLTLPLNTCIQYGVVNGEGQFIEWTGKIIRWDEKNVLMMTGKVITQIIQLEKENRENSYRYVLTKTVSHELRTPANAIISIGNLILESKELSKENEDKVRTIIGSCSFQLCLINDLLDYAQIVAGCLKTAKVSFNLITLVDECVSYIRPQLNSNVKLESVIKDTPEYLTSDPNRLKQVILNLLSNARKFTLKGSISLDISYDSPRLKVTCKDSGIGIPPSKLDSLFKEFSRIDDSESINHQGVGLGLVISNQLVKALGGNQIFIKSEPGSGSSFSFDIQAEEFISSPSEVALEAANITVPTLLAKSIHEKIEVLIVDDVFFNIVALTEMLKTIGINSKYSLNGEEAIEKVIKFKFSCILMDCEMPILDGWQTTRRMKMLKETGDIKCLPPVIAFTAYDLEFIKNKCFEAGMCEVLQKPCPKEVLFNTVNYWILKFRSDCDSDFANSSYESSR